MKTLSDLVEVSQSFDSGKVDFNVPSNTITHSDGKMNVPMTLPNGEVVGYEQIEFEPLALQHASKLLGIPYNYLVQCPADVRSYNMAYWQGTLGRSGRKSPEWLVRGYRPTPADTLRARAVLTGEYAPYMNTQMLQVVSNYIGDHKVELVRPYVDRDSLYVKIQVSNTQDGNYATGVVVKHGEIGNYQISVAPFVQRHSCTNSVVWLAGGWVHRHRWASLAWLEASIMEHVGHALKMTGVLHENMIRSASIGIPKFADVVRAVCKDNGFSQIVTDTVLMGSEGQGTRQGLVNGLSFAAHRANVEQDITVRLEELAGQVLMAR